MNNEWIQALCGGILIGIAVSLMLYWHGRATGISGIIYGLLKPLSGDVAWRLYFIGGMILGGFVLQIFKLSLLNTSLVNNVWTVGLAGLLVGFGTVLGSGCTSGHGVCGISRLSVRSLLATALFITAGILCVFFLKKIGGHI
jgi:uncharacterized membrane protein YedE/YeeE